MLRGLLLLLMLFCKIVQNGHSNLSILFCKFGYFYSAINNNPAPHPQTERTEAPQPQTEAPQTQTEASAPVTVEEPITISKAPSSVKAKAKKNSSTVSWKKIKKNKAGKKLLKQIKSIQVQYSTDPKFEQDPVTKNVGKKKTKVKLKLQKKTTYYIRVRYVGKDGVSRWSKVKRVKTK